MVLCYSGDRTIESTVSSIVRECTDIMVKYDYAKIFEEDRPRLRSLLDLRGRLTQVSLYRGSAYILKLVESIDKKVEMGAFIKKELKDFIRGASGISGLEGKLNSIAEWKYTDHTGNEVSYPLTDLEIEIRNLVDATNCLDKIKASMPSESLYNYNNVTEALNRIIKFKFNENILVGVLPQVKNEIVTWKSEVDESPGVFEMDARRNQSFVYIRQ